MQKRHEDRASGEIELAASSTRRLVAIDDGRFVPIARVGHGALGSVHRALDRHTGREVALKLSSSEGAPLIEREALILARLRGLDVSELVDHGRTADGGAYLATLWIDGVDLEAHLDAPLSSRDAVVLGTRLASILAQVHAAGVVHADLKPSNIRLPGGSLEHAMLIDFGVAHIDELTALAAPGAMVGTPGYASPEQIRALPPTPASDLFALGCVLYRALAQARPFDGRHAVVVLAKTVLEDPPPLRELAPHTPAALEDLIGALLAKLPESRPESAVAARDALERLALDDSGRRAVSRLAPIRSSERRLASLLLVVRRDALGDDGGATVVERRQGELVADQERDPLEGRITALGGRIRWLGNGALLATWDDTSDARDQARLAARCASVLHRELSYIGAEAAVVVTTGHAELAGAAPVGEVIERAHALAERALDVPLVDATTASLLDDGSAGEPVGEGFALHEPSRTAPRLLLGRQTPFVGRDSELAQLVAESERVLRGARARGVLVTGPAGRGKSRLRHELLRRVSPRYRAWIGRAEPSTSSTPYALLASALAEPFASLDGLPLAARRAGLERAVASSVRHDAGRIAVFLGELLGVRFDASATPMLSVARRDPMIMSDQIVQAFLAWLESQCRRGPVLLVLEDLQWADRPSLQLLERALDQLAELPLFVLALARPELAATHAVSPLLSRMPLAAIPAESARALARAVHPAVGDEPIERAVTLADGDVSFLEELLRAMVDDPSLSHPPSSVIAIVHARVARLSPDARRVLRAASVYGLRFWEAAVVELVGESDDVAGALDSLVNDELVVRRTGAELARQRELTFRHAAIRDAAYETLTDEDRARAHRSAAAWLIEAGERSAAVIASHLERGGVPRQAVVWWSRAARQALDADDVAGAAEQARRGLAHATGATRGELCVLMASAIKWTGQNEQALEHAIEAMQLVPEREAMWFAAAGELAAAAGKLARAEPLRVAAARLLAHASDSSPDSTIAISRTAVALQLMGEADAAAPLTAILSERAASTVDPVARARIHNALAIRAVTTGRLAEYTRETESAVEQFLAAGDLRSACGAWVNLGFAYAEHGRYARAEETLARVIDLGEPLGLTYPVSAARQNLANVWWRVGRLDDARTMARRAVDSFVKQGARRYEGGSRIYVAAIELASGRTTLALEEIDRALAILDVSPSLRCFALAVRARVLSALARPGDALADAERAAALLAELGALDEGEAFVRLTHADALREHGLGAEAGNVLRAAAKRLLERASLIDEPTLRMGFLESVPENRRTLAEAGLA